MALRQPQDDEIQIDMRSLLPGGANSPGGPGGPVFGTWTGKPDTFTQEVGEHESTIELVKDGEVFVVLTLQADFAKDVFPTPTCGGTAEGEPCIFPFVYKEQKYTSCATEDNEAAWCY